MIQETSTHPQIKPATGEPHDLPGQLEQAFEQIGATMMSDDFCAKLLAFTYVLGPEVCVLHKGLNAGIQIAQQKANLYGGHIPDMKLVKLIQHYSRDLEQTREETPWIREIYQRYELHFMGKQPKHYDNRPKDDG
jgi:hypothetical protein